MQSDYLIVYNLIVISKCQRLTNLTRNTASFQEPFRPEMFSNTANCSLENNV